MNPSSWLAAEAEIRLTGFVIVLLACVAWQYWRPARMGSAGWRRQARNLGMVVLGTLLVRAVVPVLAVQWASYCQANAVGLLNWIPVSPLFAILLAVLVLDVAIYWQHRLFHLIPLFWRVHRVHHCDVEFDVTTGVRFHPLELLLSMAIKLAVIAALGAPALAVMIFELALSLGSLFSHSNAAFSPTTDRKIRLFWVTPSMHRIHHSVCREETDSNYGFHLSVWDRLFGSYRSAPAGDEHSMPIGLQSWRDERSQRLGALMMLPFQAESSQEAKPHA